MCCWQKFFCDPKAGAYQVDEGNHRVFLPMEENIALRRVEEGLRERVRNRGGMRPCITLAAAFRFYLSLRRCVSLLLPGVFGRAFHAH